MDPYELTTPAVESPPEGAAPPTGADAVVAAVRPTFWPAWLGGLILVLACVIAYIPAMRAGFIWDDDAYLYRTDQNVIARPDGLRLIWTENSTPQWYPMVFTTFWAEHRAWSWLEHQLYGRHGVIPNADLQKNEPQIDGKRVRFNPMGYHVTNILLHAFTAVLVWRILLRLQVPGAWLAAAVFALHPVQVETVAWITERKNTLSGLFYMIALLCYLRFSTRDGWHFYFVALLAFILALFSKTVTSSLPVVILLLLWLQKKILIGDLAVAAVAGAVIGLLGVGAYFFRGRLAPLTPFEYWRLAALTVALLFLLSALVMSRLNLQAAAIYGLVPFFAAGAVMGNLTKWYEFHKHKEEYWAPMKITRAFQLSWSAEEREAAAKRSEYDLSLMQRGLIASRSLLHYAKKLVVPYPLAFFYDRWDEKKELDTGRWVNYWPLVAVYAIALGVIGLSVMFGRGIFIGCAYFALTLFPALGFFDVYPMRYSFVADHFQYLACLGLIALFAAGAARLFDRLGGRPAPLFNGISPFAGFCALVLLVALGIGTARRCTVYRNEETLWLDTIARTPTAWGARVNLAIYYGNKGRDYEAKAAQLARQSDPKAAEEARRLAEEYTNKAAEHLQAMIDGGCRWQEGPSNLGNIYALRRDFARAEKLFRMAVEFEPRLASLHTRLAKLCLLQKKEKEALEVYEKAAAVPPEKYVWRGEWPKLFNDWAELLEKTGQADKAREARARAADVQKSVVMTKREPPKAATAPAQGPVQAAAPSAAGTGLDFSSAKTPQDRIRVYIAGATDALTQRDYARARQIVQVGRGEFPANIGLFKKEALLLAASPIAAHRDPKKAIEYGEMLQKELAVQNKTDVESAEILAAAYAADGRFDDAIRTAQEGLKLPARSPTAAAVRARLQTQLGLYQARKPFVLPEAVSATRTRPAS